ncbi:hypothetical protein LCGC14_1556150, partial [marine sediment metagenome]
MMRCYSRLGDVNGARKVYKVLTESLRRELEDEKAQPAPGDDGAVSRTHTGGH